MTPDHPLRPRLGRRAIVGALALGGVGVAVTALGVTMLTGLVGIGGADAPTRAGIPIGLGIVLAGVAATRLGRDATRAEIDRSADGRDEATDRPGAPWQATGHAATADEHRHPADPLLTHRARRNLLITGAAAALAAVVAPVAVVGSRVERNLRRTSWRPGSRLVTSDGSPVDVDTLAEGALTTCWPQGAVGEADSSVVLLRLRPETLTPEPGRGDWAPEGLVAYSKLCTHMGCPVGLLQSDPNVLICPCHQAIFDVTAGARPVRGPASRPLPQLPLALGPGGELRARGDFSDPVGPGWWSRPS